MAYIINTNPFNLHLLYFDYIIWYSLPKLTRHVSPNHCLFISHCGNNSLSVYEYCKNLCQIYFSWVSHISREKRAPAILHQISNKKVHMIYLPFRFTTVFVIFRLAGIFFDKIIFSA